MSGSDDDEPRRFAADYGITPPGPDDGADMPLDPVSLLDGAAGQHHEWYLAWMRAGFSHQQALYLCGAMITAQWMSP